MGNSNGKRKSRATSMPPTEAAPVKKQEKRASELNTECNENGNSNGTVDNMFNEGRVIVIAVYNFTGSNATTENDYPDLSFNKGDVMEIINQDTEWWLVKMLLTSQMGYVPSTYVKKVNSIESFEWFHGPLNRRDAENRIIAHENKLGSFLVRKSDKHKEGYVLDVLDSDSDNKRVVKHYIIKCAGPAYYISQKKKFSTVSELIEFYRGEADGLCHMLTNPVPIARPLMFDLSSQTVDDWEIPKDELQLGNVVGTGHFGQVYKGLWKDTTEVAVKTMKSGMMTVEAFMEEANVMKSLRHSRLIVLYGVCSKDEPLYIVTEWMVNGNLLHVLRRDKANITTPQLLSIAAQVAEGMDHIEKHHLIHRDLAARNVLVGENLSIKIGDFGLARVIDDEIYTSQAELKMSEVTNQVSMGYRHPKPINCPETLYEVMLHCWNKDPEKRPTFEHLHNTMINFPIATESGYNDL